MSLRRSPTSTPNPTPFLHPNPYPRTPHYERFNRHFIDDGHLFKFDVRVNVVLIFFHFFPHGR